MNSSENELFIGALDLSSYVRYIDIIEGLPMGDSITIAFKRHFSKMNHVHVRNALEHYRINSIRDGQLSIYVRKGDLIKEIPKGRFNLAGRMMTVYQSPSIQFGLDYAAGAIRDFGVNMSQIFSAFAVPPRLLEAPQDRQIIWETRRPLYAREAVTYNRNQDAGEALQIAWQGGIDWGVPEGDNAAIRAVINRYEAEELQDNLGLETQDAEE